MTNKSHDAQKIYAVSLLSGEIVTLRAIYDGTTLLIAKIDRVAAGGLLVNHTAALSAEVRAMQEEGWSVLVEELGDTISRDATPLLLSDPHPQERRPMLAVALDWYFALLRAGGLHFAPGTEQARITESAVDVKQDDRGRNAYALDWSRLRGPQRCVLLACIAAEGWQPISDRWIKALFGDLTLPTPEPNPLQKLQAALKAHAIERERQAQEVYDARHQK